MRGDSVFEMEEDESVKLFEFHCRQIESELTHIPQTKLLGMLVSQALNMRLTEEMKRACRIGSQSGTAFGLKSLVLMILSQLHRLPC